jgi:hypothetical protein
LCFPARLNKQGETNHNQKNYDDAGDEDQRGSDFLTGDTTLTGCDAHATDTSSSKVSFAAASQIRRSPS